jgi:hypothetical protein
MVRVYLLLHDKSPIFLGRKRAFNDKKKLLLKIILCKIIFNLFLYITPENMRKIAPISTDLTKKEANNEL